MDKTRVLMTATSYPRTETDWQGIFIRRIADAIAACPDLELRLWAPDGPRPQASAYDCTPADEQFLAAMAGRGGIAHALRANPVVGGAMAVQLLWRLRKLYRRALQHTDVFHVNWLQNALPLHGLNVSAVITVLGSDFNMLRVPGMVKAMRRVLATNRCILAPNAAWMRPELERHFGDLAQVEPVNFGIAAPWFQVNGTPPAEGGASRWLSVLRITQDKIGPLFEWGEQVFQGGRELHLFGPNQGGLEVPDWVHYHGPVAAEALIEQWYPQASGFITLSAHAEGKPQVLLETMAAGLPIIASGISAHRELISHGENGYLVDSAASLNSALRELEDEAIYRNMSDYSRAACRQEYGTWDDCVARYRRLYEALR